MTCKRLHVYINKMNQYRSLICMMNKIKEAKLFREEGALKYLKNIKWNRVEEPKIFTLELLFVQNSYFRTLSSPRHMYHIKPSLSSKRPLGMNMIFSSYHKKRSWSLTDEGKPKVRRERVKRFITSVEFITF
ncbi:hypothetical protein YC2023_078334 [Brassica napus]